MVYTPTDPLIGTTSFGYDAFNRRISVTDVNGVASETTFDGLNRVRFTIQRGATPAEDLVTENVYNVFGDLELTVLPEGNRIAYGYDPVGRLVSIERQSAAGAPGERSLFTLDASGNRIREDLQRWTGSAWETTSFTGFEYSTRCQLDKTIHADGSVTENAYDCNGNLESVWDANHPSNGQSEPPSQLYGYDELDRLSSITQPWAGSGGGNAVTSYGYDVQDHLTSVTDAEGNTTSYAYSDRDLLTQEDSPVSGVTSFTYNEHGGLASETDARGVTVARTTDELDRVVFVDYPIRACRFRRAG